MFCIEDNNFSKKSETNIFIKIYKFNCIWKKTLDTKILFFFFNIIVLSVEGLKPSSRKFSLKYLYSDYNLLFLFLKFGYFVLNSINDNFKINSEKFFVSKKKISEFLIYYKYFLLIIFEKRHKFSFLSNLKSKLYLNYLLYSIYYFLDFYLVGKEKIKSEEKELDNEIIYSAPVSPNSKYYISYYRYFIYNSFEFNCIASRPKEDVPLYLFSSNRVNFNYLDDIEFSKLLSSIRKFFRKLDKKQKAYSALNDLVKKAVPVSKVIYQRRGRIYIPLTNIIYSQNIRNSLGIKQIYKHSDGLVNLPKKKNSFNFKLFITLLDILMSKTVIYQPEISMAIRKEAYNKGYIFKTFKARFQNF